MSALTPEQRELFDIWFEGRQQDNQLYCSDVDGAILAWAHQQAKIDALTAERDAANKHAEILVAQSAEHSAYVERLIAKNAELQATLDTKIDESCDKVMAMSDEQITALTRLDGSNPKDVAALVKKTIECALLEVERNAAIAKLDELRPRFELQRDTADARQERLEQAYEKIADLESKLDALVAEISDFEKDDLVPRSRYWAVDAEVKEAKAELEKWRGVAVEEIEKITAERDAALAKLAALEKREPVADNLHAVICQAVIHLNIGEDRQASHVLREALANYPDTTSLYSQPVPASPIMREGCNYFAMQGTVCNKCGEVHK